MDNTDNQVTQKKSLSGTIVSKKMQDTITVLVETQRPHAKYRKYIRISKKFLVHLPSEMDCSIGDYVKIEECRPVSKRKFFVLKSIIKKSVEE